MVSGSRRSGRARERPRLGARGGGGRKKKKKRIKLFHTPSLSRKTNYSQSKMTVSEKVPSFILTLALYSAAYMEEVFRAGLEAIPKGIIEAGQAIGLTRSRIRIKIELPIMFKKVLPSMGNYLISLFKDTSIASAITVSELTYRSKTLTTQTFRVFEVWLTTGILYVAACYLIAFILRRVEKRFV